MAAKKKGPSRKKTAKPAGRKRRAVPEARGSRTGQSNPHELSPAEETFCQHYVLHRNARAAYLHAFPRAKTWKNTAVDPKASNLLATGKVQNRLTVLQIKVTAMAEQKFEITAERVLAEYAAIAFTPATDFSRWGKKTVMRKRKTGRKDDKGDPIYEDVAVEIDFVEFTPSDELTETQAKAIAGPELSVDKFGNTILSVKPLDRMRALDKLAKYVGLDNGKMVVEHNIKGQVTHSHEVAQIEDAKDEREAMKLFDAFRTGANTYAIAAKR